MNPHYEPSKDKDGTMVYVVINKYNEFISVCSTLEKAQESFERVKKGRIGPITIKQIGLDSEEME